MQKLKPFSILVLMATLVLSACSGDGKTGNGPRVQKSASPNTPTPAGETHISTEQILHAQALVAVAVSNLPVLEIAPSGSLPLPKCAEKNGLKYRWKTTAGKPGKCGPAEQGLDMTASISLDSTASLKAAQDTPDPKSDDDSSVAAALPPAPPTLVDAASNTLAATLAGQNAIVVEMQTKGGNLRTYKFEYTNIQLFDLSDGKYLQGILTVDIQNQGSKVSTHFVTKQFKLRLENNNVTGMAISGLGNVKRVGVDGKPNEYSLRSDEEIENGWQKISADATGIHIGSGQWIRQSRTHGEETLKISEDGITSADGKKSTTWKCKAFGYCTVGE